MAAVTPAGQAAEDRESEGPQQTDREPARPESPARGDTAGSVLLGPESRHWRRQLGALAWVALEELALGAYPDHRGWATPLGVREIAWAIGTTKDTAARAVAALGATGLVTLDRVTNPDGRRRSGYRLHLPDGIARHSCASIPDGVHCPKDRVAGSPVAGADRCPKIQDSPECPVHKDGSNGLRPDERSTNPLRSGTPRASDSQPRLFDPHSMAPGEAVR